MVGAGPGLPTAHGYGSLSRLRCHPAATTAGYVILASGGSVTEVGEQQDGRRRGRVRRRQGPPVDGGHYDLLRQQPAAQRTALMIIENSTISPHVLV